MDSVHPVLAVKNVKKRFAGISALDDVTLDFYPAEVHCVVGENGAGKSTLMKIIAGVHEKDAGEVYYGGKELSVRSLTEARGAGTTILFQEPGIVSSLTVAENIFLNQENKFGIAGFIRTRRRNHAAEALLRSIGSGHINARSQTWTLPYEQWKLVELARAISTNNLRVLIIDEATAALGQDGQKVLFEQIRILKEKGVAILFVSHRLKEIFEIGDRITVMKDGKIVKTMPVSETTIDELPRLMVGRDVREYYSRRDSGSNCSENEVLLRVAHLSVEGELEDVSFTLHRGEILGVAGLVGSGMHVLGRVLFGLSHYSGRIEIKGKVVDSMTPVRAIDHGIGFVPRERDKEGLILVHSLDDNMALPNLSRLRARGLPLLVSDKKKRALSEKYIKELSIRAPSVKTICNALSGGNRQKVVLGKWLARQVAILVMACPTRGVDVGAKAEIYRLMESLREEGRGIIMISEELPELLGMSDRIIVIKEKRIAKTISRGEKPTEEKIAANML
jgi:ribose transport system ATP-binding protein